MEDFNSGAEYEINCVHIFQNTLVMYSILIRFGKLRVRVCSVCNEGAANLTPDRPSHEKLLIQIRRAVGADQIKVLEWLVKKFPTQAEKIANREEKKTV